MPAVSIDLAYRHYRDFGVAILEAGPSGADYELLPLWPGTSRTPEPGRVADLALEICDRVGASVLLLDGPQGWKDPANGLAHSRRCERLLNAPAKTGLPGNVKPANYTPFVGFAIEVFDALHERGWARFDATTWRPVERVAVESFPLSAWRSLRLPSLPAKSKAGESDIRRHFASLVDSGLLAAGALPTHDQLQALVSGLAGISMVAGAHDSYVAVGCCAFVLEGSWREGFIVNPTRSRQLSLTAT